MSTWATASERSFATAFSTSDRVVRRAAVGRWCGDLVRVASAALAVLFLVRLLGEPWPTKFPPVFPDTYSYLDIAKIGPFHPQFYVGERPMLYPLFLWVLGRNIGRTILAQSILYVVAWGVLLRVATRRLQPVVAVATGVGLLSIAVQSRFAFWNTELLSESLSFTLALLVLALWWRAVANGLARGVWPAVAVTCCWVAIRDTNAINAVAAISVAAMLAGAMRWKLARPMRRRIIRAFAVCLIVSSACIASAGVGHRARFGFYDVVGGRVLPDASLTQWFVDGGMPMNDTLKGRAGKDSWADGETFLRSPDLTSFRRWAAGPGQRRFIASLVVRAPNWVAMLGSALPSMIGNGVDAYDNHGVRTRLPSTGIVRFVSPSSPTRFLLLLGGALIALSTAFVAVRRRREVVVLTGLMLLAGLGDWYLSFVGDAVEYQRHSIGAVLRVNVAIVLALAVAVDHCLRNRSASTMMT